MSDEITYDFDLLHERFRTVHQRGGLLVLPVIHLGDTTDSFEVRRTAVEEWLAGRGIEFSEVLAEFVIMDAEQFVQAHEIITGHLMQRETQSSIEDVRRIAIGVCKAMRDVIVLLNIPAQDGISLFSNDKGIVRMEKIQIQFRVDEILDTIQREFTRREGNSSNLILVFLGVVIDEEEETENI